MAYARTGHAEWQYEYMGDKNTHMISIKINMHIVFYMKITRHII